VTLNRECRIVERLRTGAGDAGLDFLQGPFDLALASGGLVLVRAGCPRLPE
jgi:hypothetical protein